MFVFHVPCQVLWTNHYFPSGGKRLAHETPPFPTLPPTPPPRPKIFLLRCTVLPGNNLIPLYTVYICEGYCLCGISTFSFQRLTDCYLVRDE